MTRHINTWLALGDSYTIGEALPIHDSFPYQTLQILRKRGNLFHAPEIVAKTGWTTFELAEHLLHSRLNDHYDFVTLLVGVNNQYRQLPLSEYLTDLDFLLKKAQHFAGGKTERVIVISIPDWGVTPFAAGKDRLRIAAEIDQYNHSKKQLAEQFHIHFIDITSDQRVDSHDPEFVASDNLHPSAKEYAKWAEKIAERMIEILR